MKTHEINFTKKTNFELSAVYRFRPIYTTQKLRFFRISNIEHSVIKTTLTLTLTLFRSK
jgi:hypothetical protein